MPRTIEERGRAPSGTATDIHSDMLLADELPVHAGRGVTPGGQIALLTGATGFLGRYVARALLLQTNLKLVCLVRANDGQDAWSRLRQSFSAIGLDDADLLGRVEVVQGDITADRLGLDEAGYDALARRVDLVYHVAATVNWSGNYDALRAANVMGTLSLIEFARRHRPKPVLYVSTIAVCFAKDRHLPVDEYTDMTPHLASMALGYAQTKWVSECLLRSVARRGLPVTIVRPALITGDSVSGNCNLDDLTAALIEGVVSTGMAGNGDWQLDGVPVDHVAQVVARLDLAAARCQVIHLVDHRPMTWPETILWLNLKGYPVRMVDVEEWLHTAFVQRKMRGTRLFAYRHFFMGPPRSVHGRPFEVYLGPAQRRVSHAKSAALLARLGLTPCSADGGRLERYLDDYHRRGLIPLSPRLQRQQQNRLGIQEKLDQLLALASVRLDLPGGVDAWQEEEGDFQNGILHQLASARLGSAVGLRRFVAKDGHGAHKRILVKTKLRDTLMAELSSELAAVCDERLGPMVLQWSGQTGLDGAHQREQALHRWAGKQSEGWLCRHVAEAADPERDLWMFAMEDVPNRLADRVGDVLGTWPVQAIEDVVQDLACWHAKGLDVDEPLARADFNWLGPAPHGALSAGRRAYWQALFDFASPRMAQWGGQHLLSRYRRLVQEPQIWWTRLQCGHQTIIHNDFNPRNLLLRDSNQVCAIDWELARKGLPQADLAEFLCFVLDPATAVQSSRSWMACHRSAIERASGLSIDPLAWVAGFAAALDHLMAERWPLYVLMNTFREQPFLPRVLQNWLAMRAALDGEAGLHPEQPIETAHVLSALSEQS